MAPSCSFVVGTGWADTEASLEVDMKTVLFVAFFFVASGTECFGKVISASQRDRIVISADTLDGLQKGHKLAVLRKSDNTVTYVGQIEFAEPMFPDRSDLPVWICRQVVTVPKVNLQKGDEVIPFEDLAWYVGRVEKVTNDNAVEVSLQTFGRENRLRVYRETPAGIVECCQLKVVTTEKGRSVCKVLPNTVKTAIRPGDRVTRMYRWTVQEVEKDVVTISVGTEDGLSKGSHLEVRRSRLCLMPMNIGRIEVIKADAESCTCKVIPSHPKQAIVDDKDFVRPTPPVIEKGDFVVPDAAPKTTKQREVGTASDRDQPFTAR